MATEGLHFMASRGNAGLQSLKSRLHADGSVWLRMIQSFGAQSLLLPLNAIAALVLTRLIVEDYGRVAYARYGLLAALGSMLPFADLGVSAAIMNVVASSSNPNTDPKVTATIAASIRILLLSASAIACISLAIAFSGTWHDLLGSGLGAKRSDAAAATVCGILIGLGMPVAFGQRILIGLGKNHTAILITGGQGVLTLAAFLVQRKLSPHGAYVAVLPYAAALLLSLICTCVAARQISPAVRHAARLALAFGKATGGHVFAIARPAMAQMIALPIAMQSDRIVLSHTSSPASLAQYNLASAIFGPIWTLVSAVGIALWPVFAKARADGRQASVAPRSLALAFSAAAAFCCVALSVLSPWLASVASHGHIKLPLLLLVSYSGFSICQAAKVPLGMYMTDERGLRFQAILIGLFLPVNLGLSVILALWLGASGPILGSLAGVLCCQVIANWIYVGREEHNHRSRLPVR